MPQSNKFSYQDIAEKKGIYVVIHGNVYDCTQFIKSHPGGEDVLVEVSGTDATEAFEGVGHSDEARKWLETLLLGPLKSSRTTGKAT
ncbi:cytochrome b5 [Fusarium albosuccineum]|uniref:Cytochrome b5 n=1 Tax=Fusarium albosuccineum TaxID=1237068 RepID=A0A8H4L040_9HYPO|nr:cytochrome b5 [Fusarium albosuccineum]